MSRLCDDSLTAIADRVATPNYDRDRVAIGIIHFGPGAFFRAHQAVYTDDALAKSGGDWGICAVSLNSAGVRDKLAPQDGLYTLAIRDKAPFSRVIGSVKKVLFAGDDADEIMRLLCSAPVRFVTLTITEKGYALDGTGQLDEANPMVSADVANPAQPVSAMGYIVRASKLRREAGLEPLCVISCDNLPNNGDKLRRACAQLAEIMEPDGLLSSHIRRAMRFPNTMVDSITPATDASILERTEDELGVHDEGAVQREHFTQWVIEDDLPVDRPDWAGAGATITPNVRAYEHVKLRILNGAHSSLTYLGLLLGHESVSQAASDPVLRKFVDEMIREETIPTIKAPQGLDLINYWTATLARFDNPHIVHRLEQISHDGSQKIPVRVLPIISHHGLSARRKIRVVAAWIFWTYKRRLADMPPVDLALYRIENLPDPDQDPVTYARGMLALPQIFPANFSAEREIGSAICDVIKRLAREPLPALLQDV